MKRGVLGTFAVVAVLIGTLHFSPPASAAGPTDTDDPSTPLPVVVTLSSPTRSTYGQAVILTATVAATTSTGSQVPVPGATVTFDNTIAGKRAALGHSTTASNGRATLSVHLAAGSATLHASAAATKADPASTGPLAPGTAAGTSDARALTVAKATLQITATGKTITSETRTTLKVTLRSPTLAATTLSNRRLWVSTRTWGATSYSGGHWMYLDKNAAASLTVATWHGEWIRLRVFGGPNAEAAVRTIQVRTHGILTAVRVPHPPAEQFPAGKAPLGNGVHVTSEPIPAAVWKKMDGVSWRKGCPVGRSSLRYVQLNYWGFDGYRHRGAIIVNRAIVGDTVGAFTALYQQRFRIRQIEPEDAWGRGTKGPGADDYAAMRADDTSGFNCRYVDGREAQRVWSPHAYGTAIDVNTWENPYVAPTGTFPDTYWRNHRSGVGVLTRGGAAVRAFTSRGFFWGANWNAPDFQHFQQ